MLDEIIMNLFTNSTKKSTESYYNHSFSKIQDDTIHLYKGSLQDFTRKRKNVNTKKTLRLHHYIEWGKLRKYLSGILSMDNDEADLEKKKNHFINDISNFNNKHIIQCNNKPIFNIPEVPRYISSMTPTVFINGQYKSICYVNS